MDEGEIFMEGLIAEQVLAGDDEESNASAVGEGMDEDDGQYSTIAVEDVPQDDIPNDEDDRPTGQRLPESPNEVANMGVEIVGMPSENENSTAGANDDDDEDSIDKLPIPRGKSIAHNYIKQDKAVLCSFDLEHGGEYCGELQYSAEISRIIYLPDGNLNIVREKITFNKYIKPPEGAIWNDHACATHGLKPQDERIQSAKGVVEVWKEFCEFIDAKV